MSVLAVAERYARAIFELGEDTGQLRELTEQLSTMADAYRGSEDLRSVLDNPLVDQGRRQAVLKELALRLRLSPLAFNAVRLLAQRRRLTALPEVARSLQKLFDDRSGLVRATVTSARPLSEAEASRLVDQLQQQTQRRVLLEKRQDPTLLAGVVVRIKDKTIDGSLRGQLQALERRLLQT